MVLESCPHCATAKVEEVKLNQFESECASKVLVALSQDGMLI